MNIDDPVNLKDTKTETEFSTNNPNSLKNLPID